MAALQDKTLSDDSPSLITLGPATIDELAWMTAKSVRPSLWSSKTDAENWTLLTTENGQRSFAFQTELH